MSFATNYAMAKIINSASSLSPRVVNWEEWVAWARVESAAFKERWVRFLQSLVQVGIALLELNYWDSIEFDMY